MRRDWLQQLRLMCQELCKTCANLANLARRSVILFYFILLQMGKLLYSVDGQCEQLLYVM